MAWGGRERTLGEYAAARPRRMVRDRQRNNKGVAEPIELRC